MWWIRYPALRADLCDGSVILLLGQGFELWNLWWIRYPALRAELCDGSVILLLGQSFELWNSTHHFNGHRDVEWVSLVMDQTGCTSRKMVIYYTLGPLVAIKVQSWPWTWMALDVNGPGSDWCGNLDQRTDGIRELMMWDQRTGGIRELITWGQRRERITWDQRLVMPQEKKSDRCVPLEILWRGCLQWSEI